MCFLACVAGLFFPPRLAVTSVSVCCPRKVATVVSEISRCGRTGPASELSFSSAVELLRPLSLCYFSGLLVNFLLPLPLGPKCRQFQPRDSLCGCSF